MIAIIAILAAILFPVFAQAKESAKATACLSNTKQIGTAVQLYIQDYDDRLFYRVGWKNSRSGYILTTDAQRWWNLLMPYEKSSQVFRCPSDSQPTMSADATGVKSIPRSYMALSTSESLSGGQVEFPVETIVVTEKWSERTDSWIEPFLGNMGPDANDKTKMSVTANRHMLMINCTFFDGHAKRTKPAAIQHSKTLSGCSLMFNNPFSDYAGTTTPTVYTSSGNSATPNLCTPTAENGFVYP